ncbi:unnamed protein product [Eretmochelys imbricata]
MQGGNGPTVPSNLPANLSAKWTMQQTCLITRDYYGLLIYLPLLIIAGVIFAFGFKISFLARTRPTRDMFLQALMILLLAPVTLAIPEHPLRGAIQTIASAAGATNCWMCTLLDSTNGLGIEFVPLSLNDWWNKSDIFQWGTAWYTNNPRNDSGEVGQWHRTVWGRPVEYVTGSSKEVYPICFETQGDIQMGSLDKQQCAHTIVFDQKSGGWTTYPPMNDKRTLKCWKGPINGTLEHRPLFSIYNATIVPLNMSRYPESRDWYNQSLFFIPSSGHIYNPLLIKSINSLLDQCNENGLFRSDQILEDLLIVLLCTNIKMGYCVPYHQPIPKPEGGRWHRGPYSPILSKEPGLFFICGDKAYKYLPVGWTGRCSLGHAVPEGLTVHPHVDAPRITNLGSFIHRSKRKFTYNPLIERPSGFHRFTRALIPWLGITELEMAIANVSGQLEIALNHTADALGLLNEQLQSVAQYALQNRIALDATLAQQGGVCAVINQSCCFYVNHSGQIEQDVVAIKGAVKILHAVAENGQTSWMQWLAQHLGFSLSPFLHSVVNTVLTILIIVIVFCVTLCIMKRLIQTALSSAQIRYLELKRDPNQFREPSSSNLVVGYF